MKQPLLSKLKKFTLGSRTSSLSAVDNQNGVSGPTPLKAKSKMKARKASTDNLLGNGEPKRSGPMKASSMEDIHSLSTQASSPSKGRGGMAGKIVDAAVKLYLPDHSYKYIEISPVSRVVIDL